MVWCNHCAKHVPVVRPDGGSVACDLCGRVLEDLILSDEVTFIKNAAGQSQASGNYVNSVQTGISSSRERRLRIARDDIMQLSDALGINDENNVVDMAVRFFRMAADTDTDKNFTRGRRTELVQSSCLYLACREKKIRILLIDISSYLRVSVYELGTVYLQFCKKMCLAPNRNYEGLVDPSVFIPRFTNILLKGARDKEKNVADTARDIIASMKRDWMQTGRKPSGICGAAIYIAALSHHIMCSRTDIGKIVHMCEATITKRLIEFANTDAASLNVDELTERERRLHKETFTPRPDSDKGEVICEHKGSEHFGYGLCERCYKEFITISGGFVGGSDPPAFQRAEKERIEKAAREKNEGGIEKSEGETDWDAEASDESGNFSDLNGDPEVDNCLNNEEEMLLAKTIYELKHGDDSEEKAAKEAALKTASEAFNASNANCPEYARNLVESSKASVAKSRKEKRQKRAEEAKNAPPAATAMEAVTRMLENKRLSRLIDYDALEKLFGTTSPVEKSPKRWKKSNEHEDNDEEMSVIF